MSAGKAEGAYLGASPDPMAGPEHGLDEIAIAGRSNVGKSSLLNALLGRKLARTSNTPGRTQMLHFFPLRSAGAVLVDLPGLGYARAPRPVRRKLDEIVRTAVARRPALRLLLLLVDIRRTPGDFERALLDAALRRGLKVLFVATKTDRVPKHKLKPALVALERWTGLGPGFVLPTSARTGAGIEALRAALSVEASAPGSE